MVPCGSAQASDFDEILGPRTRGRSPGGHRRADRGVGVRRRADRATVHPHGDLDLVSAPALQAALDGVVGARRVVLDLSGVSFVDSAAVHVLVDVDRRARRDGFELSLVPPAPPADLAIELCGLYETLPFTSAPDG